MKTNFFHKLIGTSLGLGYLPQAPGTFGALGGLLSGWAVLNFTAYPNLILFSLIVFMSLLGVYSSNKLIPEWGDDPSKIVIDEVVGMWIAMLFIPTSYAVLLSAFVLFRFFDIAKPLYIRRLEKIPGGWGIMLDDVAAGIYANITIQVFYLMYNAW